MTQEQFWNLDCVKEQQEIQKRNPYGSKEHREAFEEIKRIMAVHCGWEHADDYMGNYED